MREVVFIRKNQEKWQKYENQLNRPDYISPDEITYIYIDLTDDLAYANTYYPNSKITAYLNIIAGNAHRRIYKTKKESGNSVKKFYLHDFPLMFYQYQKYLYFSFFIFVLFVGIGVFSASQDGDYVRLILGDGYVDMTLENIEKGDPMAVYKQANSFDMFLGITINNIKVALSAFVYGIFLGLGTLVIILQNAVMLGAFQYFFYEQGVFWESVRTIWIHGTIEISVIIIAATAGFIIASGILMPGTYTRTQALIRKSRDGLKIMISTIPFFIIAGFLEGFVTRHTEMPDSLAVSIILLSLGFIIYYYVILPGKLHQKYIKNHAL